MGLFSKRKDAAKLAKETKENIKGDPSPAKKAGDETISPSLDGKEGAGSPRREESEKRSPGCFTGFVLLSEPKWDKEALLDCLHERWGIAPDLSEEESEHSPEEAETFVFELERCLVAVSLMPFRIPDNEAEHCASSNYLWPEAGKAASAHKAHLMVAVLGRNAPPVEAGKLYVKVAAACLAQPGALGIYTSGTVLSPDHFLTVANAMDGGELPVMDWVFIGLYQGEKATSAYTNGLEAFGRDELEVLNSSHTPAELHEFFFDICFYLLEQDVMLKDGETIGFTAEQKLPITRSPGVAVDGMSLKIAY